MTVTAEWSVHGFAEPKKSSEEETPTLEAQSTNNDESIFITVTNCHKKALTHAPDRAPTDAPRQTLAPTSAAAAPPQCRMPAAHSPHSNAHIQTRNDISRTKGFCPHMAT
jgi:hypothetical protein